MPRAFSTARRDSATDFRTEQFSAVTYSLPPRPARLPLQPTPTPRRLRDGAHGGAECGSALLAGSPSGRRRRKLKAVIHVTATVVRDGVAREIPLRDLVPGDIIKLAGGDMIPGDVRLLSNDCVAGVAVVCELLSGSIPCNREKYR